MEATRGGQMGTPERCWQLMASGRRHRQSGSDFVSEENALNSPASAHRIATTSDTWGVSAAGGGGMLGGWSSESDFAWIEEAARPHTGSSPPPEGLLLAQQPVPGLSAAEVSCRAHNRLPCLTLPPWAALSLQLRLRTSFDWARARAHARAHARPNTHAHDPLQAAYKAFAEAGARPAPLKLRGGKTRGAARTVAAAATGGGGRGGSGASPYSPKKGRAWVSSNTEDIQRLRRNLRAASYRMKGARLGALFAAIDKNKSGGLECESCLHCLWFLQAVTLLWLLALICLPRLPYLLARAICPAGSRNSLQRCMDLAQGICLAQRPAAGPAATC